MNPPPRMIDDWKTPFENLPSNANWISVDQVGVCCWHWAKPYHVSHFWLSRDAFVADFSKHVLGRVCPWIQSEEWRTAIREVQPEERVGYVKKSH